MHPDASAIGVASALDQVSLMHSGSRGVIVSRGDALAPSRRRKDRPKQRGKAQTIQHDSLPFATFHAALRLWRPLSTYLLVHAFPWNDQFVMTPPEFTVKRVTQDMGILNPAV